MMQAICLLWACKVLCTVKYEVAQVKFIRGKNGGSAGLVLGPELRWLIRLTRQVLCHQHNSLKMRVLLFVLVGARWRVFVEDGHKMGTTDCSGIAHTARLAAGRIPAQKSNGARPPIFPRNKTCHTSRVTFRPSACRVRYGNAQA